MENARLPLSRDTTLTVDGDCFAWNRAAYDQHAVVTVGDHQYTTFWDENLQLTLARRDLEDDRIDTLQFPHELADPEDPHHKMSLGVDDGDGRLHLSYNHHASPLNYAVSDAGFLTDPPDPMSTDDFDDRVPDAIDSPRATYPRFFADASGTLYLAYREGGAGDGDVYLHRHDSADGSWTRIGTVFARSGRYGPRGSSSRNAYTNGFTFDANDRLHVTWTYRDHASDDYGNHDVWYAYSDDGGVTWRNDDGEAVADLSAGDPIRVDDPGIRVVDTPYNAWLINQGNQAIDPRQQPHVLTRRAREPAAEREEAEMRLAHYWRTPDGEWHEQLLDTGGSRGDLLFDDDGDLYAYARREGELVCARATAASGWTEWEMDTLFDGPLVDDGEDGYGHDRVRWERDGVLTVPTTTADGAGECGARYVLHDFVPGEG